MQPTPSPVVQLAPSSSPAAVASARSDAPPSSPDARSTDPAGLVRYVDVDDADIDRPIDGECGAFRLTQTTRSSPLELLTPQGLRVHRATAENPRSPMQVIFPRYCFDLTGDGKPELVYERFSGGAHCCTTTTVITPGQPTTTLLRWDGGDGHLLRAPRQLDAGVSWELVGYDMSLADYTAFADTPGLPVVFALDHGTYARSTKRYVELLRDDRQRMAACTDCRPRERGLYLVGSSVLMNDWGAVQDQLTFLTRRATPEEAAEYRQIWNRAHAQLIRTLR